MSFLFGLRFKHQMNVEALGPRQSLSCEVPTNRKVRITYILTMKEFLDKPFLVKNKPVNVICKWR